MPQPDWVTVAQQFRTVVENRGSYRELKDAYEAAKCHANPKQLAWLEKAYTQALVRFRDDLESPAPGVIFPEK